MQLKDSPSVNFETLRQIVSPRVRIMILLAALFTGEKVATEFRKINPHVLWQPSAELPASTPSAELDNSSKYRPLTPTELVPGTAVLMRAAYNERKELAELTEDTVVDVVINRIFEYKMNDSADPEIRVEVIRKLTGQPDITLAKYLFLKK